MNAAENQEHLCSDNLSEVDSIKLDDKKIEKGAVIIQVSKDGTNNWTTVKYDTNYLATYPRDSYSIYQNNEMQLLNGCYYRIIVAYRTEQFMYERPFFLPDEYKYNRYIELYKFYASYENTSITLNDNAYQLNNDTKLRPLYYANKKGYRDVVEMQKDNPQFNKSIGYFYIVEYTDKKILNTDLVFLKNPGDKIRLYFNLKEDINKINGNEKIKVVDDSKNYDSNFQRETIKFGKGTLFIRKTDEKNKSKTQIFENFLVANTTPGSNTTIALFEEGDYEIALDYKINIERPIIAPIENYYQIKAKFSIRNSNTMVYPRDIKTNSELSTYSIAKDGFYLDYNNSKYLNVTIKKENYSEGADGLQEDTRFNKSAKDNNKYTDSGIYTIKIKNTYTDESVEKKIYVGNDKIIMAHIKSQEPISSIKDKVNKMGYILTDEGDLISPTPIPSSTPTPIPSSTPTPIPSSTPTNIIDKTPIVNTVSEINNVENTNNKTQSNDSNSLSNNIIKEKIDNSFNLNKYIILLPIISIIIIIAIAIIILLKNNKSNRKGQND